MVLDTEHKKCHRFLESNGWEYDSKAGGGGGAFIKDGLIAVELMKDEIVLLDDNGDFMHLPKNYFALVGALMELRQIAANYISA